MPSAVRNTALPIEKKVFTVITHVLPKLYRRLLGLMPRTPVASFGCEMMPRRGFLFSYARCAARGAVSDSRMVSRNIASTSSAFTRA